MRRVKADARLHTHGKPLKASTGSVADQMCLEDFGCTYRERLEVVEREVAWQRTGRLDGKEHQPAMYRCQFCGEESPVKEWGQGGDECPRCKRVYDAQLAQDCP